MNTKESKPIRAFLAIDLADDLRPKVTEVQEEFKKAKGNIKFVSSENMHFTLKFFGDVDEDMIEDLKAAIEKVVENYSSFELNIKKCGSFPNQYTIKVIWLGINDNPIIGEMQKDLDKEFKKLGFKKEKNYVSHLTIGRVRSAKHKKQIKQCMDGLKDIEIGKMTVSKISLKKSTLTSTGPIYEDIEVFDLN